MIPIALTIAGSDPSGGAGIQADLKTFHRFQVYGEAAISLITVQNTRGVTRVEVLSPELVRQQIEAVLQDIPPNAVKTGALGNRAVVEAVAEALTESVRGRGLPLVVDPVMMSSQGESLLDPDAKQAMIERLLPITFVFTPNLDEATALVGFPIKDLGLAKRAAKVLLEMGPRNILIKGGHFPGDAIDLLLLENGDFRLLTAEKIDSRHTHGTGCTYSAAITAGLASGASLLDSATAAKLFITKAISSAPGLGEGHGPLNHFA
ncbi:MAG: bifunctional hydroxymethylpyrimidine kinase/phosphomethylpyrimidine kinase [Acidobacteriota bacterium]